MIVLEVCDKAEGFALQCLITNAAGIGSEFRCFKQYLLGLKVVQYDQDRPEVIYYNHVSLFMINFDGSVTQLWNHSLGQHHTVYDQNNFAVDAKNELVYLGVEDQFLALDLYTGKVKIQFPLQRPNLQYFWNYDYVPQDNAMYCVCTGNNRRNWCRIKLGEVHAQKSNLEFLYELPNDSYIGAGSYK